ncbi:MAG: hypothetical protein PVH88_02165 [Ignavibacteria bacterium]|jgi:hypothetical protein
MAENESSISVAYETLPILFKGNKRGLLQYISVTEYKSSVDLNFTIHFRPFDNGYYIEKTYTLPKSLEFEDENYLTKDFFQMLPPGFLVKEYYVSITGNVNGYIEIKDFLVEGEIISTGRYG